MPGSPVVCLTHSRLETFQLIELLVELFDAVLTRVKLAGYDPKPSAKFGLRAHQRFSMMVKLRFRYREPGHESFGVMCEADTVHAVS